MSFEDLWDQVDLVIHHSELRREGVEDLLDLLKSRSALELKYHQGLEKLCNSPKCVSRSGTLAEAVSALKSHWQHRAAKGRALVSLLMSEVVKPLELLLTQQSPLARAQAKEGKILEKALLQKAEKYEKAQFRYHKQSREAETLAKAFCEAGTSLSTAKLSLAKLEVDVALEQCISALADLNAARQQHMSSLVFSTQKALLSEYEVQDQLRAHQMKQCLSKVAELESACEDCSQDFEEITKRVREIDPLFDQSAFVSEHKTEGSLESGIAFRPYESSHPLFKAGPMLTEDWMQALSRNSEGDVEDILRSIWAGEALEQCISEVCVYRRFKSGRKLQKAECS